MLDALTLDQLRTFLAVVDEGSFSGAARRLRRVQSAVSQSMAKLEDALGVTLWDRSSRRPTLTDAGHALHGAAERVTREVDALRSLAGGLSGGLEATVSLCVDALFPVPALVELCRRFAEAFPSVELRVDTQTLAAVSGRVLAGQATLGVVGPMGLRPELGAERLGLIHMRMVVAPAHPLARFGKRPVPVAALREHVQIVLSERDDSGVPDQAVFSPRVWRVADLQTKQALLRAGLGFGHLPAHVLGDDLGARRLAALRPDAWAEATLPLPVSLVYRSDTAFGPAHRWVREELARQCGTWLGPDATSYREPGARAPRARARTPAGRARRSAGGSARS